MKKSTQLYILCIFSSAFIAAIPSSVAYARILSIQSISPNTTVGAGTAVSFNVMSDDYAKLSYIVNDSLPGSTISNSSIVSGLDGRGVFSWTPQASDIGVHNLTIVTIDALGFRNTLTQTLTVTQGSNAKVASLSPSSSVLPDEAITFEISAPGYLNPTFSISDSFAGTSITSANIDQYGNFSWKPKVTDVGTHNLTIQIRSSNGREETLYQTLTVKGIAVANAQQGMTHQAQVGKAFSFTMNTYGMNYTSYSVSDLKGDNSVESIGISGNNFSWTPQARDVGNHTLTIAGNDGTKSVTTQLLVKVAPADSAKADAPVPVVSTPVKTPAATTNTTAASPNATGTVKKYTFATDLKVGSKGAAVIELQKRLKTEVAYSGPTNGSFGELTKAAVIKYQAKMKISKSGTVGPATRAALNK